MLFETKNRRLYVIEATHAELDWFKNKLEFKKEFNKVIEIEKLWFEDWIGGGIYTFEGLFEPLKLATRRFKLEHKNPTKIVVEPIRIDPQILEGKTLFDFQCGAIRKSVIIKKGIIQLPTGGGKTLVALGLIRHLLQTNKIKNGLVLVPSIVLAEQFVTRALQCGFNSDEIGIVHGYKKEFGKPITVGVSNSIHKGLESDKPEILSLFENCDFFAADEFHHGRANTWIKIVTACANTKYLIGFTATPFHNDDVLKDAGDALVQGITGGPIFKISHNYLRNVDLGDGTIGLIAKPIIHFIKNGSGKMSSAKQQYNKVYQRYVVDDKTRNDKIIKQVKQFHRFKFPVLVLLQRKEHAIRLMNMLGEQDSICVFGNNSGVIFDEYQNIQDVTVDYSQFATDFQSGLYNTVFASQVFDEGVDLPEIGAVINAGAGKSRIKINQRTGRGMRAKRVGVNEVYVVDFCDRGHVFLFAQYKARKKLYEEMESEIVNDENIMWMRMKKNHDLIQGAKNVNPT